MGVGSGLYMYDVVVKTFTFTISSSDEFLFCFDGFPYVIASVFYTRAFSTTAFSATRMTTRTMRRCRIETWMGKMQRRSRGIRRGKICRYWNNLCGITRNYGKETRTAGKPQKRFSLLRECRDKNRSSRYLLAGLFHALLQRNPMIHEEPPPNLAVWRNSWLFTLSA